MLTRDDLTMLERDLRGERVLSVYIDGRVSDPAERRQWRQNLDNAIRDAGAALSASDGVERLAFDGCVKHIEDALASMTGALGDVGWAGFATRIGLRYADSLPVPMPTMARWTEGPWLSPYVRALKEERVVLAALVDSQSARLLRYANGRLESLDVVRARETDVPPGHMGDSPRERFHAGVRGPTQNDKAQRERNAAVEELLGEVAERLLSHGAAESWTLIGGVPTTATHLEARIRDRLRDQVIHVPSLRVDATDAEIAAMARQAGSTLRNASDLAVINSVADTLAFSGHGAVGRMATRRALDELRVQRLYFTHRYLDALGADAEYAVRAALRQGADVEEVSGEAADRLNDYGGIAATLRYALTPASTAGI
jgi:hypothetical protein